MEADWSVEIGEGLPSIAVPWSAEDFAWVDLRGVAPAMLAAACQRAVESIGLASAQPMLEEALARLNAPDSPWLTAKCDAWQINTNETSERAETSDAGEDELELLDPYEFEAQDLDLAQSGQPLLGCACYIDLIAVEAKQCCDFSHTEAQVKKLIATLRETPCSCARVDLVLRAALVQNRSGFAITAYATGCGLNPDEAQQNWARALDLLINTLLKP